MDNKNFSVITPFKLLHSKHCKFSKKEFVAAYTFVIDMANKKTPQKGLNDQTFYGAIAILEFA
ncbi:hypothetical protein ACHOLT_06200 [Desulfitobacterium sp. Sab5]|uniref:hypothetical protein n=1 Tax=Desulfitobacterium nosdiversum TaxID=3375356 RepID=UPI003CEC0AFC